MRLNTLTILFSAVMATMLPSKTGYEAALAATPEATGRTSPQETALVPEFVSLTNLSQFLMASEETASASQDTRQAAEALSAKFAAVSGDSNFEIVRSEVQRDRIVPDTRDTRQDPKGHPAVIAISTTEAATVPDPKGSKHSVKVATRKTAAATRPATASKSAVRVKAQVNRLNKGAQLKLAKQSGGHRHHLASVEGRLPGVGFVDLLSNPTLWN